MLRFFFYPLACLLLLTGCRGPNDLAGTWHLQAYGAVSNPTPAQAKAYITFEKGNVSGNAGCNTFSGQYRIVGNELLFSNLFTTLIACLDQNAMQQESLFLNGLNNASGFTVQDENLRIYYDNGKSVLLFRRAP